MAPNPATGRAAVAGRGGVVCLAVASVTTRLLAGVSLAAAAGVWAQGGGGPVAGGGAAGTVMGVAAVRAEGTNRWTVTSALSGDRSLFAVDLDALVGAPVEPQAQIRYGPAWDGFLWLSGRWGLPGRGAPGEQLLAADGTRGLTSATLSYTLEASASGLVMSTRMEFTPELATGAFTVRLHQTLCASRDAICDGAADILLVRAAPAGARDWGDGTADHAWYRWSGDNCPDAPPGSHTGVIRATDSALRAMAAAADPPQGAEGAGRPAVAGAPLVPGSSIGGYFAKTGVGSCGWAFHQYRASAPQGLSPVFARGRSGAETRFRLVPADPSGRFGMKAGDRIDAELSFTMLPCEVSREDIEDLNEADLHLFGTGDEQVSSVAGWYGTRNALGLLRSDGSLILLGLGRQPEKVPVPAATVAKATNAYRLFDVVRPTYDYLDLRENQVEVRPGWITVIDCGAALWEPSPTPDSIFFSLPTATTLAVPGGDAADKGQAWPQPPTGGPFPGILMRK